MTAWYTIATSPITGETTARAIKPAPIATARMSLGRGARPPNRFIFPPPLAEGGSPGAAGARTGGGGCLLLPRRDHSADDGVEHRVGRLSRDLRLGPQDQPVPER